MIIRLGSQTASAAVATPWDPSPPVGQSTYATISVQSSSDVEISSATAELPQYHPAKKRHAESNVTVTLWTTTQACAPTAEAQMRSSLRSSPFPHTTHPVYASRKHETSISVPKSFRARWTSSVLFPSWYTAELLSVANVLDEKTQATFTHILVALSGNSSEAKFQSRLISDTVHGLALLRVEYLDLIKVAEFRTREDERPSRAVILRGPTILAVIDNTVYSFLLFNHIPGEEYTPEQQTVGISAMQPVLGPTERDTLALILASSGQNWNLTAVRSTSSSIVSSHVAMFPYAGFPSSPVLIYGLCSSAKTVAICDNGTVVTLDTHARSLSSLTSSSSGDEFTDATVFGNTVYLSLARPPFSIHVLPLHPKSADLKLGGNLTSLSIFPECRLISTSTSHASDASRPPHGHFYTVWRGRMLMINATTGSCCAEHVENISFVESENGRSTLIPTNRSRSPSVETMVQNLRERVDSGVSAYTQTLIANSEKQHMLRHTASLLTDVARAPAIPRRTEVLNVRLQRVITRADNRVSVSTLRNLDADEANMDVSTGDNVEMGDACVAKSHAEKDQTTHLTPVRLWVAGQSFIDTPPAFLRVTRAHCSLDPTETYVVVDIDAHILETFDGGNAGNGGLDGDKGFTFLLGLRIDHCVSSISNVTIHRNVSPGCDVAHIRAAAPLADIVTTTMPLNEMHTYVRVDGSNGRCQHLGQFSMRDLLSKMKRDVSLTRHTFEEDVYVIAEGRNAHKLNLELPPLNKYTKEVFRQEEIMCLVLTVTNGVDFASAMARLRLAIDDEVSLRWTPKPHKSSLDLINYALTALQHEIQGFRQIATPNDAIGYSPRQVAEILTRQKEVDEAFGKVEEFCQARLIL